MSNLLLPFARRVSDRRVVTPWEVQRGLACGCVCPGCEYPVQARQGTEKAWHFAHAEGAPYCGKGYETSVHEMAKQMLNQGGQLCLPAIVAEADGQDDHQRVLLEKREISPESTVMIDNSRTSLRLEGVTPDVVLQVDGVALCVEIVVFHRLSASKQDRLVEAGLPSLLIDLSLFKNLHADRDALAHHLFENPMNRSWVFHPEIARIQPLLEGLIQEQIEKTRRESLEARERHRQNELRWEEQHRALAVRRRSIPAPPSESADESLALPRWRAAFPRPERIVAASEMLADRIKTAPESIRTAIADVTRRSDLSGVTPEEVAERWAQRLNCRAQEIFQFLQEADFLIE